MIVKIAMIMLTSFVATSSGHDIWNGLVASWNYNTSTHFYELPRRRKAAVQEGWTRIPDVKYEFGIVGLGYLGDPTVVLLFDDDTFTGVQFAFPVSSVVNSTHLMDYSNNQVIIEKTINRRKFYTATVRVYDNGLGTRRLGFQEKHRFFEIPLKVSEIKAHTPYTLKNCVSTMGIHYYPWNSKTKCTSLYPWALLTDGENLIGVSLQGIANVTHAIGKRVWWESFRPYGLLDAISDPPACFLNGIEEFGPLSLHLWLVKNPKEFTCG